MDCFDLRGILPVRRSAACPRCKKTDSHLQELRCKHSLCKHCIDAGVRHCHQCNVPLYKSMHDLPDRVVKRPAKPTEEPKEKRQDRESPPGYEQIVPLVPVAELLSLLAERLRLSAAGVIFSEDLLVEYKNSKVIVNRKLEFLMPARQTVVEKLDEVKCTLAGMVEDRVVCPEGPTKLVEGLYDYIARKLHLHTSKWMPAHEYIQQLLDEFQRDGWVVDRALLKIKRDERLWVRLHVTEMSVMISLDTKKFWEPHKEVLRIENGQIDVAVTDFRYFIYEASRLYYLQHRAPIDDYMKYVAEALQCRGYETKQVVGGFNFRRPGFVWMAVTSAKEVKVGGEPLHKVVNGAVNFQGYFDECIELQDMYTEQLELHRRSSPQRKFLAALCRKISLGVAPHCVPIECLWHGDYFKTQDFCIKMEHGLLFLQWQEQLAVLTELPDNELKTQRTLTMVCDDIAKAYRFLKRFGCLVPFPIQLNEFDGSTHSVSVDTFVAYCLKVAGFEARVVSKNPETAWIDTTNAEIRFDRHGVRIFRDLYHICLKNPLDGRLAEYVRLVNDCFFEDLTVAECFPKYTGGLGNWCLNPEDVYKIKLTIDKSPMAEVFYKDRELLKFSVLGLELRRINEVLQRVPLAGDTPENRREAVNFLRATNVDPHRIEVSSADFIDALYEWLRRCTDIQGITKDGLELKIGDASVRAYGDRIILVHKGTGITLQPDNKHTYGLGVSVMTCAGIIRSVLSAGQQKYSDAEVAEFGGARVGGVVVIAPTSPFRIVVDLHSYDYWVMHLNGIVRYAHNLRKHSPKQIFEQFQKDVAVVQGSRCKDALDHLVAIFMSLKVACRCLDGTTIKLLGCLIKFDASPLVHEAQIIFNGHIERLDWTEAPVGTPRTQWEWFAREALNIAEISF